MIARYIGLESVKALRERMEKNRTDASASL
jgi:hypothetical protein